MLYKAPYERILSKEQCSYLVRTHKREQNGKIRDRIKAVLLCDSDYKYSEVARILLLDNETIRRHVEDYCSKLKIKPENGGSENKLTESETQALIAHLNKVTDLYVKAVYYEQELLIIFKFYIRHCSQLEV